MILSVSTGEREPFSMTNRGLSIKFNITPWSADTYLAYLDCAEQLSLSQEVRVGIFLRRLTEDDQYVRVNLSSKGLWLDTKGIYYRDDRPKWQRQLFVRQKLEHNREKDCLEKRVYGFKILNDSLPLSPGVSAAHFSTKRRVVLLRHGEWGCVTVIDVSAQHKGLCLIALGFDLDFHPICLLIESSSDEQHQYSGQEIYNNWSSILSDVEWDEIIEGSRVYRRTNHDGIWALRGHRLRGLDVLLSESFTDKGSLVTLKRDGGRSLLIWEFDIDNLVGPFRNHQHSAFNDSFGNREHFQTTYGLGLTDEDLEEGDSILKALYGPVCHFEPAQTALQPTITAVADSS